VQDEVGQASRGPKADDSAERTQAGISQGGFWTVETFAVSLWGEDCATGCRKMAAFEASEGRMVGRRLCGGDLDY
jgi:hypothetical protein